MSSAADIALQTAELLEAILLQADIRTVLLSQRVNHTWHSVIAGSRALQKELFFQPKFNIDYHLDESSDIDDIFHKRIIEAYYVSLNEQPVDPQDLINPFYTTIIEPWLREQIPAWSAEVDEPALPLPVPGQLASPRLADDGSSSLSPHASDVQDRKEQEQHLLSASSPTDSEDSKSTPRDLSFLRPEASWRCMLIRSGKPVDSVVLAWPADNEVFRSRGSVVSRNKRFRIAKPGDCGMRLGDLYQLMRRASRGMDPELESNGMTSASKKNAAARGFHLYWDCTQRIMPWTLLQGMNETDFQKFKEVEVNLTQGYVSRNAAVVVMMESGPRVLKRSSSIGKLLAFRGRRSEI